MAPVLRECNNKEFHHVYPKAFLKSLGVDPKRINALINFCFLPRAANNLISDKRPSQYRSDMPATGSQVIEILSRALCPTDIFHDQYDRFVQERTEILIRKALSLMGATGAQAEDEATFDSTHDPVR